ncbi:unnamed protein product [Caenorhabditis brenneri]
MGNRTSSPNVSQPEFTRQYIFFRNEDMIHKLDEIDPIVNHLRNPYFIESCNYIRTGIAAAEKMNKQNETGMEQLMNALEQDRGVEIANEVRQIYLTSPTPSSHCDGVSDLTKNVFSQYWKNKKDYGAMVAGLETKLSDLLNVLEIALKNQIAKKLEDMDVDEVFNVLKAAEKEAGTGEKQL